MIYSNSEQYFNPGVLYYSFNIHKYSTILDISENNGVIYVHYIYNDVYNNNDDMKIVNFMIIDDILLNRCIPDNYQYLTKIEILDTEIYLSNNDNSIKVEHNNIKRIYLVFFNNHKELDEVRDEKIDKLLN